MKYTGQTLETLKTQFRPQAEQTVKTRLALEYIAKAEGITATEEDIETEYQKIAEAYGIEIEKVKASIDADAIADDVRVGKAVLALRDYAVITVNEGASDVVEVEPEVVSAE
jgi:trigger factor